jgi:rSAM/selenodomain-associated transferase 2
LISIAVIVPVLNESARLPALLEDLSARDFAEIIVVDGGSTDGSAEILQAVVDKRIAVLASERGRALQMNTGARAARSDLLLFLHADTTLPVEATRLLREACAAGTCWGRFDVRFAPTSFLLFLVQTLMNQRSTLTGIATGDQAIFVRRELFLQQGSYAEIPLMEDIELSRRLKRVARPLRINTAVVSSARRWQRHGTLRTILFMWKLRLLYWLGVPPHDLVARYADVR